MNIAIVGGNLSGAYLGYRLAENGFSVTLFDNKIPYEKPCGGGITYRTFKEFPFLQGNNIIKNPIARVKLISHTNFNLEISLDNPIYVCSRRELSEYLLNLAIKSGVRFIAQRVSDITFDSSCVNVVTKDNNFKFDFVVGADGARSLVRRKVRGSLSKNSYILALGYYFSNITADKILVKFNENLKGYSWVFPREDHISVGIGSTSFSINARELKHRLDDFLTKEYPNINISEGKYYSAFIPYLSSDYLSSMKCVDDKWALIGDSAGFADPITGEGIYYALKSAEILSECFINKDVKQYDFLWKAAFGLELQKSAVLSSLFYNHHFSESMIQLASKNKAIMETLSDLIAGQQSYTGLKKRLVKNLFSSLRDSFLHLNFSFSWKLLRNLKNIYVNSL